MHKIISAAVALVLAASMLTACRNGNVSDRNDGMITEPTATSETAATMPSTDTAPIATTEPAAPTDGSHSANGSHSTDGSNPTEATMMPNATEGTDAAVETGPARNHARGSRNMH